jgi:hypothetical protein
MIPAVGICEQQDKQSEKARIILGGVSGEDYGSHSS